MGLREAFGARLRLSPGDSWQTGLASPPVGPLFFLLFGLCPQFSRKLLWGRLQLVGLSATHPFACPLGRGVSLETGTGEREGSRELEMGGGRVRVEERDVEAERKRMK